MTHEAAVASLTAASGSYIDQFIAEPTPVLVPAISVHGSRAWSVVPGVRRVTKTIGRGKNATEVEENVKHMIAVTSDWMFLPYDNDALEPYGLMAHNHPFIPDPPFPWHTSDVIRYVRNKEPGRTTDDIFEELVDIFRDYVEYGDSVYYDLMALYVMQSYVFTLWPATGYLHFNGTMASGKSRSLDVIQMTAYNARQGAGLSQKVLYRMLEGQPGVLCLDEQEMFKSDEGKIIYSQLLAGYRATGKALLNERDSNENWNPTAFSLYGPKAIASINQVDPTLASRSIIIPMVPAIKQPSELPLDDATWRELHHDLHVWALQNAVKLQRHTKGWNQHARFERAPNLINRSWEVARPYIVIADTFDQALVRRMTDFFNEYFSEQAKRMQETDKALMLLRALPRVIRDHDPAEESYYSVKAIHETLMEFIEIDQRDYYKTRHVHSHMTTLRFKDRKTIKGGLHYRLDEDQIRQTFKHRSIQPLDEDRDWYEGNRSYARSAPVPTQEQYMEGFDL